MLSLRAVELEVQFSIRSNEYSQYSQEQWYRINLLVGDAQEPHADDSDDRGDCFTSIGSPTADVRYSHTLYYISCSYQYSVDCFSCRYCSR